MNVSCPDCRSVFRVDPAKVPVAGVHARCSVCGGVIAVATTSVPAVAAPATADPPGAANGTSVQPTEQLGSANTAVVAPPSEHETASSSVGRDAFAVVEALAPVPARALERSEEGAGRRESEPARAGSSVTLPGATPPIAAQPVAVARAEPPPVEPSPTGAPRLARPVNPYLNNTPELRARRLARALVSDLVAYNPQKREEGLRNGTLRQLFRDEIRKSWDEYVEQVGASVAESTPHFQDALNDVLAGGRRVF